MSPRDSETREEMSEVINGVIYLAELKGGDFWEVA